MGSQRLACPARRPRAGQEPEEIIRSAASILDEAVVLLLGVAEQPGCKSREEFGRLRTECPTDGLLGLDALVYPSWSNPPADW
jgi:hypothetical protein